MSTDPDETPRFAASHLGLHCLLRHVWPNTVKYNIVSIMLRQTGKIFSDYQSIIDHNGRTDN